MTNKNFIMLNFRPPSRLLLLLILLLSLSSCLANVPQAAVSSPRIEEPQATPTQTATTRPTATTTPTPKATGTVPAPTSTPTEIPATAWVYQESGRVIAPILLYHHVNGNNRDSRYRVSVSDFRTQMQTLYDAGYTAITISTLLDVLIHGGELPEKPIVITFDDGNLGVYENAFPIMQEFGFPGVMYIVANRINNVPEYVNVEQLTTLIKAGWEIGSHGNTHTDITKNHAIAPYEIETSKLNLERALGVEVNSFAYPFGEFDDYVGQVVFESGYQAGMGLGTSITHTLNNLDYLNRIEIHGDGSVEDFKALIHLE